MKKTFLLIGIALMSIATVNDSKAQKGFQLGIQVTPQNCWLVNNDDLNDPDFKYLPTISGSAGIWGQYNFTERVGLGVDLIYSMQGQRFELRGNERYKRLDYLKVPVLLSYSAYISENIMFIGKIGPQLGVLSIAKLTDSDGDEIISDQSDFYTDMHLGAVALAGIGIKLKDYLYLNTLLRGDCSFGNDERNNFNPNLDRGGIATFKERAETQNVTAGITIGLTWLFNTREMEFNPE